MLVLHQMCGQRRRAQQPEGDSRKPNPRHAQPPVDVDPRRQRWTKGNAFGIAGRNGNVSVIDWVRIVLGLFAFGKAPAA